MDISDEMESTDDEQKVYPGDILLEKLSISPYGEKESDDLQIIGLKVKLGSDQIYSFPFMENVRSRSDDILTVLKNSETIFARKITEDHHGYKGAKECFKIPYEVEQAMSDTYDEVVDRKRSGDALTALKLRLGPFCMENDEFGFQVTSTIGDKCFMSEDESFCSNSEYFDTEDQFLDFEVADPSKYTSNNIKHPQETSVSSLKNIIAVPFNNPHAGKGSEYFSDLAKDIQDLHSTSKPDTNLLIDNTKKTLTPTKQKNRDYIQNETIFDKYLSQQTDTESETKSSLTDFTARYSTDRMLEVSTQTVPEANATPKNPNTHEVNMSKIMKKETGSNAQLIIAEEEKLESDDMLRNIKSFYSFVDYQKAQKDIYKNFYYKDSTQVIQTHPSQTNFQQFATLHNVIESSRCHHSCENLDKDEAKYDVKFLHNNISQPYCYKSMNLATCIKQIPEKVEKLKLPDVFSAPKVEYDTIARKERLDNQVELKIDKIVTSELKTETIVAVRVQKSVKVERAVVFAIPVNIYHFLNSFKFSVHHSSKPVINPIKISLEVSQTPHSVSPLSKPPNEFPVDVKFKSQTGTPIMFDGMHGNSVIVGCMPSMMALDEKHSQICLCSSCYVNVQSALGTARKELHRKNCEPYVSRLEEKLKAITRHRRSTSPKIKPKNFDYTSTDAWTANRLRKNGILIRKNEASDIGQVDVNGNECNHSLKSSEVTNLNSACEIVNDHLLNLRVVDGDSVRKAAEFLHKAWFETAASKHSSVEEVRFYLQYFQEFSNNLLKTLLHSTDNNGNNILHFAFANNRFDLVEEFLKNTFAGELLKKTNKMGNSPLMICSISLPEDKNDWSAVRKSLEMGDVNAKSLNSGQTPLMNAASCNFVDMVSLLLDVGANPNLQDKDGSTALMYAAEHGHEKCIKALMNHNMCDPTIKDKDGQTACSVALINGYQDIAILIHMQALEKRYLSKNSHSTKRYVWTNNEFKMKNATLNSRSH